MMTIADLLKLIEDHVKDPEKTLVKFGANGNVQGAFSITLNTLHGDGIQVSDWSAELILRP